MVPNCLTIYLYKISKICLFMAWTKLEKLLIWDFFTSEACIKSTKAYEIPVCSIYSDLNFFSPLFIMPFWKTENIFFPC